jgi:hypothetical protein
MFKKLVFPVILAVLVTHQATLSAEYVVKNGAGYSESNMVLAMRNFSAILLRCSQLGGVSLSCPLSAEESKLASAIEKRLASLVENPDRLSFDSELENPERFPPKMGLTHFVESEAPFRIVVNRTLLYIPGINGKFFPLSLPEAADALVRIFANVERETNQTLILNLAQKIAGLFAQNSLVAEFGQSTDRLVIPDPRRRIQVLVINRMNAGSNHEWSSILVQDSELMRNLDDEFRSNLPCPKSEDRAVDFGIESLRKTGFERSTNGARLSAKIAVKFVCQSEPRRLIRRKIELNLELLELLLSEPSVVGDVAFGIDSKSLQLVEEQVP